jgi:hypothetical protein
MSRMIDPALLGTTDFQLRDGKVTGSSDMDNGKSKEDLQICESSIELCKECSLSTTT